MNGQEHLKETKQDNRKALPKFLLIMVCALVLGGVLGFFGSRLGDLGAKEALVAGMDGFSRMVAPWLLYVCTLASILGFFIQSHLTRTGLARWDGEDEAVLNAIDGKVTIFCGYRTWRCSWGMPCSPWP